MSITKEQFDEYRRLENVIIEAATPVIKEVAAVRGEYYAAADAYLTVDDENIQASWYASSNDHSVWMPVSYLWTDWRPIEEEKIRTAQQATEKQERAALARLKQKYEPPPAEEAAQ